MLDSTGPLAPHKATEEEPARPLAGPYDVWTDGACSGNPGPGGWAAILCNEMGDTRELSGGEPWTSSNRMELTAAIEALEWFNAKKPKSRCQITIHSDSQYMVRGITEWLTGWIAKGWRKPNRDEVANRDLWERLIALAQRHEVTWLWVRGHTTDAMNILADRLATGERDRMKTEALGIIS